VSDQGRCWALYVVSNPPTIARVSTITAILEPAPDGTLHVPVPEAWRKLPIRIRAEMEPAEALPTEAYNAEWRAAFGAVTDETFVAPVRSVTRQVESLDTN
jgi:hypothetical protein